MSNGERDHCPYCHRKFEIMKMKFSFDGPATVWTCPNCALVRTAPSRPLCLEAGFSCFRQGGNDARTVVRSGERGLVRRSRVGAVSP